jgi:hypothetical protein
MHAASERQRVTVWPADPSGIVTGRATLKHPARAETASRSVMDRILDTSGTSSTAVSRDVELPGVMVVNDFTPYPDAVRASAIAAGFGTWRPNKGEVGSSIYDGMGFWGDHAMMIAPLMQHMGAPIVPNSMFFRVTNADTEAAYVHSDREAGDYTCVAYLSDHEDAGSGTGFYRHRHTGMTRMPSFEDMRGDPRAFERLKNEMVRGSDEDWERIAFVPGRFNRAVIFDAPLFHARSPRHGFASTPEQGRMVWVCHFMILRGAANG